MVIYGDPDSYAKTFADENDIPYRLVTQSDLLRGDINDDGLVSVEDAQLALVEYVSGMAGLKSSLTAAQRMAGDINGDRMVTVEDAQTILLYYVSNSLAGIPTSWETLLGKIGEQYIRTQWHQGNYPVVKQFTSRAELDAYITENNEIDELDTSHGSGIFTDAAAKYTEDWFKDHKLLLVVLSESSGGIRNKVTAVTEDAVHIAVFTSKAMTDDMAAWHILIVYAGA